MVDTIKDVVIKAAEKALAFHGFDKEKLNHDITCFNETAIRSAVVYDSGHNGIEITFVVIGLRANLEGEYIETFFMADNEMAGIDAMLNANAFINDHD